MSAYRFSKGDFVEITGSHRESGKRGYVFEAARDDNSCVCVGIDECQLPKTSHPPPIHVAANCLKLIRKHGSSVVKDLGDYMSCEFPCLGMVASSYSRDKKLKSSHTRRMANFLALLPRIFLVPTELIKSLKTNGQQIFSAQLIAVI
jgi:hypothetical protein